MPSRNDFAASNSHYLPPVPSAALVPSKRRWEIVPERSRHRWEPGVGVDRESSEVKAALPGRPPVSLVLSLLPRQT